jgi:hypothetical protein
MVRGVRIGECPADLCIAFGSHLGVGHRVRALDLGTAHTIVTVSVRWSGR